MEVKIKKFSELTTDELYKILQLRNEVFVVEQNCIYQDADGKDQEAYHLFYTKNNEIIAYTRIFEPGKYFEKASIGRVVVSPEYRGKKYGKKIMKDSISFVEKNFNTPEIEISAQTYLKKFYNEMGFVEKGTEYLEDDIPHIKMIYKKL